MKGSLSEKKGKSAVARGNGTSASFEEQWAAPWHCTSQVVGMGTEGVFKTNPQEPRTSNMPGSTLA